MWAAGYGHKSIVEFLIKSGANKELKDDRGRTAAEIAGETGYIEISAILK